MVTDNELRQIIPNLPAPRREQLLPALRQAMDEYGINNRLRAAAFLANLAVESAELTRMVENLNYSAQRLLQVFPKYFKTSAQAAAYARQPEKIANRVYASRIGNGDEASGDGWRYRGRGVIQITGRANYRVHGAAIGVDIESNPDLAAEPDVAFRIAGAFFKSNNCNELADRPDFGAVCKAINGKFPPHGWTERQNYYNRAKQVLTAGGLTRGIYPGRDLPPEGADAGAEKGGVKKPAKKPTKKPAAKKGGAKTSVKKTAGKKGAAKKSAAKKAGRGGAKKRP